MNTISMRLGALGIRHSKSTLVEGKHDLFSSNGDYIGTCDAHEAVELIRRREAENNRFWLLTTET